MIFMYYFYMLKSEKDRMFYYGSTTDLKKRVLEHNSGAVKSTKTRRPLDLVYYEAYIDLKVARLREKQVKASGNARKTIYNRLNLGE